MTFLKKIWADPRHFQIASLSTLLGILVYWGDFTPSPTLISLTLLSVLLTQLLFSAPLNHFDLKSPFITGLSLCLLLRVAEWWIYPLAAFIAISSKFVIRYDNKHIFNPANIAIVSMLILLPEYSWISPGQWGNHAWLAFLLASLAFLVLYKIPKADISLFFIGSYAALLFARALWLGDPLEIPMHHLQSGAILIFAFFMISDPKTTPDHRKGRFIFAFAVALLGFTLQFGLQIRPGLFYALTAISMITPFIDKWAPSPRYEWRKI